MSESLIWVRGSCADGNTCPTIHYDRQSQEYIVQGYVVTDPVRLAELGLPAGEAAVRLPERLLPELRQAGPC